LQNVPGIAGGIFTGTAGGIAAGATSGFGKASLTISNSTITGNSTVGEGGGLSIGATTFAPDASVDITLTGLTIDGNSAFLGGGIDVNVFAGISEANQNLTGGVVRASLSNSTISGNRAAFGGGIYAHEEARRAVPNSLVPILVVNASATLTVTNSTVFANHADSLGGGVDNTAAPGSGVAGLTLLSDTIAFNDATTLGGGILENGATIRSTIIANNTAGTGADAFGAFVSGGHNLIGQTDGSSGFDGGDLTGTAANPLDPLFGDFGNFGGQTQTLALLAGSPAIGTGDPAGPTTDERGVARSRTAPSIGAFEFTG
jgi:hypothetical protein